MGGVIRDIDVTPDGYRVDGQFEIVIGHDPWESQPIVILGRQDKLSLPKTSTGLGRAKSVRVKAPFCHLGDTSVSPMNGHSQVHVHV